MEKWVQALLAGDRRALARMLTAVENRREGVEQALAALFPHTGRAWVIGITGAPGTGKSSLVNTLARTLRQRDTTVGIIAVDPTSPFSGGAILGDRIRMRDLAGDPGVFIRSMATRGSLGGLARATRDGVRVMDAAGFDVVLVETVGAGQSEVDIARTAQTTVVVEAPGMGDDVQAIKAGILEIADVLVVNKADRPGATQTVRTLNAMLKLGHPTSRRYVHHGKLIETEMPSVTDNPWLPPIVRTVAIDGTGIDRLIEALERHRQHLMTDDVLAELENLHIEIELRERLRETLLARLLQNIPQDTISAAIVRIQARELDPQSAVRELLDAHTV